MDELFTLSFTDWLTSRCLCLQAKNAFFFQAEDGIRARDVTGVQTCALPILIGSTSRVLFGFIADKTGGAILTTLSGVGLIVGASLLVGLGLLSPTSIEQFDMFVWVMLGLFFFTGIGNAATFRQYPIVFQHNPRQAAGVIGWTAAVAAFGPFIFSMP